MAFYLRIQVKETIHHGERFRSGNDGCIRICLHEVLDIGSVIRLHVLNYQIIWFSSIQNVCDIVQPLMGKMDIHGVHDCDLLIVDHIGIVGHSAWHYVLTLKEIHLMVIHTNVFDSFSDIHCYLFSFLILGNIVESSGCPDSSFAESFTILL